MPVAARQKRRKPSASSGAAADQVDVPRSIHAAGSDEPPLLLEHHPRLEAAAADQREELSGRRPRPDERLWIALDDDRHGVAGAVERPAHPSEGLDLPALDIEFD